MDDFWSDADVICTYSRAQAIEDGVLVDANAGDFAEVTRQHFKVPVAMTAGVFSLIENAVKGRSGCDYKGVWHDICWIAKTTGQRSNGSDIHFRVLIAGRLRDLWCRCGPGDTLDPVLTFMCEGED